ncbi:MAG: hypothetical protein EHM61_04525 [Acidobacteria bacterium]|nr:MAG: hypothetical protein EHM61_04525 [Acidobacteriota bacterium]
MATAGSGQGTVTSTPAGITCGSDCSESYASGTSVTLTAAAGTGSTFAGWSGACSGTGSCTVTMDADRAVTATFNAVATTRALTISKAGTGQGTVTSTPAGITCGSDCSESYASGTSVTLTAAAGTGSTFAGWSGACSGTGSCTVTMDADRAVTATFNAVATTRALTVSKAGTGQGTVTSTPAGITCGSDCSENYASGTSVTLTAAATAGSMFQGWSGACSGTGTCTLVMDVDRAVTATFQPSSSPDTQYNYTSYFPQFGDGAGIVSTLILENPNPTRNAKGVISFWDAQGSALTVDINGAVKTGQMAFEIPPKGVSRFATDGVGTVAVGSVQVQSDMEVGGVIVFSGAFGVAGVGAATLTRHALVPVQMSAGVRTGVAISTAAAVEVTLQLRGEDGQELANASTTLQLSKNGQKARYVEELFPNSGINLNSFRGTVEIKSPTAVAAMALLSSTGEMATFPVACAESQSKHLTFSEFGDGQGVRSTLIIMNPSAELTASGTVSLNGQQAGPLSVDLNGTVVNGSLNFQIPPLGIKFYSTDGSGPLSIGSVRVTSDNAVGGTILFSTASGVSGVGATPALQRLVVPIESDASKGISTGIALSSETAVDMTVRLRDDGGILVPNQSVKITLPAKGQTAKFPSEIFQGANLSNFQGSLEVLAPLPVSGMAIRLSPGSFATLPVIATSGQWDEIAQSVIGSAGGTVSATGFSLTVPAGAFSVEKQLKLYASDEESDSAEPVRDFRVVGIPSNYSKPLEVRVKRASATGEAYLAFGEETWVPSLGRLAPTHTMLDTRLEADVVVGTIPIPAENAGAAAELLTGLESQSVDTNAASRPAQMPGKLEQEWFFQQYKYAYTTEEGHFKIFFRANLLPTRYINVGDALEIAYKRYREMGFSYAERTKWPMAVTLDPLDPNVTGVYENSTWGHNSGAMQVNLLNLTNSEDVRITCAHEFMHFVQSLYDPRDRYRRAKFEPSFAWLNEATAVWAEAKLADQPATYVSAARGANTLRAPLEGFEAGNEANGARFHGYGMAALAKYAVDTETGSTPEEREKVVSRIYEKILSGRDTIEALNESRKSTNAFWCFEFFSPYLMGTIYGVSRDTFWWNRDGDVQFPGATNGETTRTNTYFDLSAQLYGMEVKGTNIDKLSRLTISARNLSDPVNAPMLAILKYSRRDKRLYSHTPFSQGPVKIEDVQGLKDLEYTLWILVINPRKAKPYTGSTNIELKAAREQAPPPKQQYRLREIKWSFSRESPPWTNTAGTGKSITIPNPQGESLGTVTVSLNIPDTVKEGEAFPVTLSATAQKLVWTTDFYIVGWGSGDDNYNSRIAANSTSNATISKTISYQPRADGGFSAQATASPQYRDGTKTKTYPNVYFPPGYPSFQVSFGANQTQILSAYVGWDLVP